MKYAMADSGGVEVGTCLPNRNSMSRSSFLARLFCALFLAVTRARSLVSSARRLSSCQCHPMVTYGAGGDNGIAKIQKRREISVCYYYDRSHHLPPHP
eukprot:COSAG01_NODE_2755_length_7137_cov_3.530548_8_plen_98_part_00